MFKLDFNVDPCDEKISVHDKILMLGSCFSSEMGSKLRDNKFDVLSNPFGTLYNPISIFRAMELSITGNQQVDTVNHQDIWYDWDAHSIISGLSKSELIDKSLNAREKTRNRLKKANWIIITPGTSIVYAIESEARIVANCHKRPSQTFSRQMLLPTEIIESFGRFHQLVMESNPNVKFIFTVSPVRHVKDGLITNNQSKATLLLVIKHLTETLPNCFYFPSYEIVIDELRDYRFYLKDMIHPNEQAIDYIWNKFVESYFDKKASEWISKWNRFQKDIQHRPYHVSSPNHQKFLRKLLIRLQDLGNEFDLSEEIKEVKKQIK